MPAPDRKPFLLRIPPDLWRDLEKWAADDLRSVNGQIEFILKQAVAKRRKDSPQQESEGAGQESPAPQSRSDADST